jgi:hypothetical protein
VESTQQLGVVVTWQLATLNSFLSVVSNDDE